MASNDPRRSPLLTAADHAASAAFRPDAGQLIGHAVGVAVAGVIQKELPDALAAAIGQEMPAAIWQVHPPRMCAYCLNAYNTWENDHADLVAAAVTAAAKDAQPGGPLDFRPHLPEELRPLVPNVERAITAVNGTECCKGHVSEALGQQQAAA